MEERQMREGKKNIAFCVEAVNKSTYKNVHLYLVTKNY